MSKYRTPLLMAVSSVFALAALVAGQFGFGDRHESFGELAAVLCGLLALLAVATFALGLRKLLDAPPG